jgi:hypothetical protein
MATASVWLIDSRHPSGVAGAPPGNLPIDVDEPKASRAAARPLAKVRNRRGAKPVVRAASSGGRQWLTTATAA